MTRKIVPPPGLREAIQREAEAIQREAERMYKRPPGSLWTAYDDVEVIPVRWYRICSLCPYAFGQHEYECPWRCVLEGRPQPPPLPGDGWFYAEDGTIIFVHPSIDWLREPAPE